MNAEFDAIVLKTAPFKENDILLSLLTSSAGRVDALVRGAKKSRRSILYTQQFSYSAFSLYRSGSHGLFVVDGAEIKEPFYELRHNLTKISLAQYFAEVCLSLPKESASGDEEKFLRLILNSLYILCKKPEISPTAAKLVFELKFAKYLGLSPDFTACTNCKKDEGDIWVFDRGILCKDCAKGAEGVKINEGIRKIILHILSSENMSAYGVFAEEDALLYVDSAVERYFSAVTEKRYSALDYYNEIRDMDSLAKKGSTKPDERNQST